MRSIIFVFFLLLFFLFDNQINKFFNYYNFLMFFYLLFNEIRDSIRFENLDIFMIFKALIQIIEFLSIILIKRQRVFFGFITITFY